MELFNLRERRLDRDYANILKMSAATEGRKILVYVPTVNKKSELKSKKE